MSTTPVNKPNSIPAAIAAIRTLEHKGYTYTEGAELWRPPLGPRKTDPSLMSRLGAEAMNGNFWVYQGDGTDHLESLTCPVVIDPRRLRQMIENCDKFGNALQRIGSALGLLEGTDLTMACAPAIEALRPAGWKLAPPIMTEAMKKAASDALDTGRPFWPAVVAAMPEPPTDGRMLTVMDTKPSDPHGSYRDATGELVLPVRRGWSCEDSGVEA